MLEREAMALLVSTLGVSTAQREAALNAAGSALAVLADPYAYARVLGAGGARALERSLRERDEILGRLSAKGVHLVLPGEAGYPVQLASIARPPRLLFVQGEADLNANLPIAIVGMRRASEYGLRHSREIARDLAGAGACIVSGLALGVDAAAHEGALDAGGRTIAVLGGAHDRFYPAQNKDLAQRILGSGGSIVTEYPMGMPPTRYSFLHRNRIIAGLSLGVLATQGEFRSGAHRTASDAADEGREVFALPGSVDDTRSQLPHKLIGEGAHLITCAADILRVLAPQKAGLVPERREAQPQRELLPPKSASPAKPVSAPFVIPEGMDDAQRAVLTALMAGEQEFDALCEATGIKSDEMGALLMELEMEGHVDSLAGLRYALRREV